MVLDVFKCPRCGINHTCYDFTKNPYKYIRINMPLLSLVDDLTKLINKTI